MTRSLSAVQARRYILGFASSAATVLFAVFLFFILVDPYAGFSYSLPLERPMVMANQPYSYPVLIRTRQFDSIILGTSTGRSLDPELLNRPFNGRFANLAMSSAPAWEQWQIFKFFHREIGPPKVLLMTLDSVWCRSDADKWRTVFDFPEWLYDDNPWNDYLHLINGSVAEAAWRLILYNFGLYQTDIRQDGYWKFVPAESEYDAARARKNIWPAGAPDHIPADVGPPELSEAEKSAVRLPAMPWMNDILAAMPAASVKILAWMPVHIASQPPPGSRGAADEAECKARISKIARAHGAIVIDYRIRSALTSNDLNYWDSLHYRTPIAESIARQIADAVLLGKVPDDGSLRLLPP